MSSVICLLVCFCVLLRLRGVVLWFLLSCCCWVAGWLWMWWMFVCWVVVFGVAVGFRGGRLEGVVLVDLVVGMEVLVFGGVTLLPLS
ncbi:hypothetical protein RA267_28080, partial [Pseudomonas syringae pv. tagetis]|uniref:hypothetical protein n=1 Tax=Pseudomonas syringae group genomosp. 7 TaxID=251699 RepID=UPI00376FD7AB